MSPRLCKAAERRQRSFSSLQLEAPAGQRAADYSPSGLLMAAFIGWGFVIGTPVLTLMYWSSLWKLSVGCIFLPLLQVLE